MHIVGDRTYVEIPGERLHELPPLLVRDRPEVKRLDKVFGTAADIIESEDMMADSVALAAPAERERCRTDLALNLVDQYLHLVNEWQWGDAILQWIRQCEITFEARLELRNLLRADVWPHAGRTSFVSLLADKAVVGGGVTLEKAVGLRLSFRQPPPIACCSNQFLLYLNGTIATSAFETWSQLSPGPHSLLPPERFRFDVFTM